MNLESNVESTSSSDLTGLQSLLKRASSGDESALPGIRGILEALPESVRFLGGDLAQEAEQALIREITSGNIAQREALIEKLAQLRTDLVGPRTHPLERLLVERVVLCWLAVHHADIQYSLAENVPVELGKYLQQQQDRSHRRYLAAIKCLATVRRLAMPG